MKRNNKLLEMDSMFEQGVEWGTSTLKEKFGEVETLALNQSMRENYQNLKQSIPQMKTKYAQRLLIYAIRALLLYRELSLKMAQDNAFDIITQYLKDCSDKEWKEAYSPLLRSAMKNRFLFPRITRLTREQLNRSNDPNGWQYDFLKPQKGHLVDFNVIRCGMLKFLTEQGVPELTKVLCGLDFYMAENFLPRCAKLIRTQTIAEGAKHCDFRYVKA